MRRVSDEALVALRHCQAQRDLDARHLGAALIEFNLRMEELRREYGGHRDEYERRVGALYHNFATAETSVMERIKNSQIAQKEIGDKALVAINLNPDRPDMDYTIDLNNGVVKVLRDGVYRPLD